MLDINFIKKNIEYVKKSVKNKNAKVDIDALIALDTKRRELINSIESLASDKKKVSKSFIDNKDLAGQKEAVILKNKIQKLEKEYKELMVLYTDMLYSVPNVSSPDMPIGKSEDDNVEIKKVGNVPVFDFEVKNHVELGEQLDIIDIKKAAEVSGSRFYYLKNEAVLLQFALVQYVFDVLGNEKIIQNIITDLGLTISSKPFSLMIPPVMIREEVQKSIHRVFGDQTYSIENDTTNLVASAEHTMAPYHMNEVIEQNRLPLRYVGYSTAFRQEAGTYGKDMGGILRTHQFDKLEMESFTDKESGKDEQKLIVALQEYLVQQLNIPYRLVHVCTGDTGGPDYDQYDIECWIPSQRKYRETHTSDYMTDYQTRGINAYYKSLDGKKVLLHTNDATAFAIGRILIAIFENFQTKDGEIVVPKILQKYVGKEKISRKITS